LIIDHDDEGSRGVKVREGNQGMRRKTGRVRDAGDGRESEGRRDWRRRHERTRRVNYGKDRCAYVPRNQHQQQQHNQMAATMAAQAASQITGFPSPFNPIMPMSPMMSPLGFQGGFVDPNVQVGNRTVYRECRWP